MSYFRTLIPMIGLFLCALVVKEPFTTHDLIIAFMTMLTMVYCTAEIIRAIRETKKDGTP